MNTESQRKQIALSLFAYKHGPKKAEEKAEELGLTFNKEQA